MAKKTKKHTNPADAEHTTQSAGFKPADAEQENGTNIGAITITVQQQTK